MRMIKTLATVFMIMVCIAGCSKKSALEGTVVDGKGKPVAGIKMIAKQIQPIKGFEQFETTTRADGSFKFDNLFPNSEYDLFTYSDEYVKDYLRKTVKSGPEGETVQGWPLPFELRFATPNKDVVKDTKTGVTWARNANIAGRAMGWYEAEAFVGKLNYAGHSDWRLPTKEELEAFKTDGHGTWQEVFDNESEAKTNGHGVLEHLFDNEKEGCYWSSTKHTNKLYELYAWGVDFGYGLGGYVFMGDSCYVWPVR